MITAINLILRFGSRWKVKTACGHSFTVSADELKKHQLYLGKRIQCEQCKGKL